jgi:hypothetical protein
MRAKVIAFCERIGIEVLHLDIQQVHERPVLLVPDIALVKDAGHKGFFVRFASAPNKDEIVSSIALNMSCALIKRLSLLRSINLNKPVFKIRKKSKICLLNFLNYFLITFAYFQPF